MPRRSPTPTALDEEAFAERRRLVELLENLSEADWDHDSLCAGWRVREVVAHMTMPFRTGPLSMLAGLVKARFSFDTFADSAARRDTAMYDSAQLLDLLRQNVTTVWHPPGGGEDGALSHDLIHGLDITEPLGLPAPPADRIGLVLRHGGARALEHFGCTLDRSLVATDTDATVGSGARLELPAKDILLVITGRRTLDGVVSDA